jgi:ion channel
MFLALLLAAFLVAANILVHYEMLRLMSAYVPGLPIAVRLKVLVVVLGCFVAHTVEVWLYALAYLLIDRAGIGSLQGQVDESFADFLYFSATSYSTLGFGDVYPTGALRLISGIEGINGLFLIAWSTSFTYFVMDRLWPLHPDRNDGK